MNRSLLIVAILILSFGFAGAAIDSVDLISPLDGAYVNGTPSFTFIVRGDESSVCDLYVDDASVSYGIADPDNATTIIPDSLLDEGLGVEWYIKCNMVSSATQLINIDYTSPVFAFIQSPGDSSSQDANWTALEFSADDNLDPDADISVALDGTGIYDGSLANGSTYSTLIEGLEEGWHNIIIWAADAAGNLASEEIAFAVDYTAPSGIMASPVNATTLFQEDLTVCMNSSDNLASSLDYEIYLDSVIESSGSTANGTETCITLPGINDGGHTLHVVFRDAASNEMMTGVYNIIIDTAETFAVQASDSDFDGNIELNWTADQNYSRYYIYRSTSPILTVIGLEPLSWTNRTSFEDTGCLHGTEYFYSLTFVSSNGTEDKSRFSASVSAVSDDRIIPQLTDRVIASIDYDGSIRITWNPVDRDVLNNSDIAVSYRVSRVIGGAAVNIYTNNITDTGYITFTDRALSDSDEGTNFTYYINTVDDAGLANTNWSNNSRVSIEAERCNSDWDYDEWSRCIDGQKYLNRTRECYGEEITQEISENCKVASDSGSSSGGPGGQATFLQAASPVYIMTQTWQVASPEFPMLMKVTNSQIGISEVKVNVNKEKAFARLAVERLSEPPSATLPEGTVYRYFRIDRYNLENEDITDAYIKFRIEKSWFDGTGIDPVMMSMLRFTDSWDALDVDYDGDDDNYHHYIAWTPGFSYFAAVGKPIEAVTDPVPAEETQEPAVQEEQPQLMQEEQAAPAQDTPTGMAVVEKREAPPQDHTKKPTWMAWVLMLFMVSGLAIYLVGKNMIGMEETQTASNIQKKIDAVALEPAAQEPEAHEEDMEEQGLGNIVIEEPFMPSVAQRTSQTSSSKKSMYDLGDGKRW
jgi:PGF-pre-PGF domain-containing protein